MRRKKNLKLPNGFGSVSYIGDGRRKPYRARKTEKLILVDKTTGEVWPAKKSIPPEKFKDIIYKPKYINIGTFETYQDAIVALHQYNENPYDTEADKITLNTIIDRWEKSVLPTFAKPTQKTHANNLRRIPYDLCSMKIRNIRVSDMEKALSELNTTKNCLNNLRTLLRHLFNYAVKHEYCDKNYADFIDLKAVSQKEGSKNTHEPLNIDEIEIALTMDHRLSDILHVALYTGMRPNELLTLKKEHIFLSEGYIRHGSKTKAGRDRIIPIHDGIAHLIKKLMDSSCTGFLFENEYGGKVRPLTYDRYRQILKTILPGHTPHDTRHTFITQWRFTLGLDDSILHLIVGHDSGDISETVYTHRPVSALIAEMSRFGYKGKSLALFKTA